MQADAGPNLLRDWIDRAAARDRDKPWIVCADDGRTVSYGQLRDITRRIATVLRARGHGAQRPRRAARQQFDRASADLFRRHGLWRDDLHGSCRDEPQPARQHLRAAEAEARAVSGRPRARRSARRGLGAAPAARALGTKPASGHVLRRGRARSAERRAMRRRPGRRRGDPVHLRHQRHAQGRGAELSRASVQHRSDRRRLRHHGRRPRLRFPLLQLGLGAASRRAGAGQPRRHAGHGAEILGQPLLPACARAPRHRRRRQSDHRQHPAQQRADRASRHPALAALHHLELGAADGRGMAAVRADVRHSDRAGLRLERDRLDRGDPRREPTPRHRRTAVRLSRPRDRRRRRPAAARRARPARSRSAALPATTTAISPTTAA